jgi:hypothetical protein
MEIRGVSATNFKAEEVEFTENSLGRNSHSSEST